MNIYIVKGGIGKHVLFSSMIEKLSEINNEKIIIVSSYPDLFKYHPKVEISVNHHQPGFYDEYIKDTDNNVIYQEPYYSNYVKGKTHILKEWTNLYNIEYKDELLPDIYVDDFSIEECKRFVEMNNNFIITQFTGGQSPLNLDVNRPHINMGQIREYPRELAQIVVNKLKDNYPDLTILNYALPNEQSYNLENTISIEAPYLFYVSLLHYAKTYIGVDSSLQHFAANRYNKKIGVVLWGDTSPICLGYNKNMNLMIKDGSMRPLCNPIGDIFNKDGSPWKNPDLTCMQIEPDSVIENVELCIDHNKDISDDIPNISKDETVIEINEKTQNMLFDIQNQIMVLDKKYKTVIETYISSQDKEGEYNISSDGKKLVKTG